ncbi:hypothetical protein C8Q70DRAFT_944845 [Cubamyces menziesii]|uniref:Uncharacterized protein n=1 Tax=Trametes cubensis TaxID=1111947 RepID=A0AAD7XBD6_9APHY|nr:hypothetical protein C8Q70DRAFT_944845 [Cubamyces menziesii]KAJ8489053.1 hypothetical protein ONZ51_g3175 [Trametes cubensis]
MSSETDLVEADCPRCNSLVTTEYTPTGLPGRVGDICAIQESPNVPVHEILTGLPPRYPSDTISDTTETVGSNVQTTPEYWRGFKSRPCIVTRSSQASVPAEVCLMATFGHTAALRDIPEILQRFCVPVYPHLIPSMQHLHTCPEWMREDGWVLARRMLSTSHISGRWRNMRSETPEKSAFKVDEEALLSLLELCERKQEEWDTLVQREPEARARCLTEYGDILREKKRARRAEMRRRRQEKRLLGPAVPATTAPPACTTSNPSEHPSARSPESLVIEDVPMGTTAIPTELIGDVEEQAEVEMVKIVAVVEVLPAEVDECSEVGDADEHIQEEVAAN